MAAWLPCAFRTPRLGRAGRRMQGWKTGKTGRAQATWRAGHLWVQAAPQFLHGKSENASHAARSARQSAAKPPKRTHLAARALGSTLAPKRRRRFGASASRRRGPRIVIGLQPNRKTAYLCGLCANNCTPVPDGQAWQGVTIYGYSCSSGKRFNCPGPDNAVGPFTISGDPQGDNGDVGLPDCLLCIATAFANSCNAASGALACILFHALQRALLSGCGALHPLHYSAGWSSGGHPEDPFDKGLEHLLLFQPVPARAVSRIPRPHGPGHGPDPADAAIFPVKAVLEPATARAIGDDRHFFHPNIPPPASYS